MSCISYAIGAVLGSCLPSSQLERYVDRLAKLEAIRVRNARRPYRACEDAVIRADLIASLIVDALARREMQHLGRPECTVRFMRLKSLQRFREWRTEWRRYKLR